MDRRTDARFLPPPAARATLRPGCLVVLVDVSAGGALVEADRPLRPGARVHLQVATSARRYSIAAHVVRCMVWSLDPVDGVRYRGALRFEHRIDWCWAESTRPGNDVPEHGGPAGRGGGQHLPVSRAVGAGFRQKGGK
ncbi:MAG TPA: PilZ domain-containing protein [Vicinamibacterales bacterium]|nr:PilZ domain-containing protein [Vicinamibacterales bacterium]